MNQAVRNPMEWGPILLCSWPGLLTLWYRGKGSGLLLAILFAILLNTALISSFLWPGMFGAGFAWTAWGLTLLVWGISAWWSFRRLPDVLAVPTSAASLNEVPGGGATLFNQAQTEYLKGHWTETELLLTRQLERRPRDMESRLLLATMYRHTGRRDEALEQLDALQRFDESIEWRFEIGREREYLQAEGSTLAVPPNPGESGEEGLEPTARAG